MLHYHFDEPYNVDGGSTGIIDYHVYLVGNVTLDSYYNDNYVEFFYPEPDKTGTWWVRDPRYDLPDTDPNYLSPPADGVSYEDYIIDLVYDYNYIPTNTITWGNICEPVMTVTASRDILDPMYNYYSVGAITVIGGDGSTTKTSVKSTPMWVLTNTEVNDGIYTYTFKKNINYDAVIYNELQAASFSTLGELWYVLKKLIIDKSYLDAHPTYPDDADKSYTYNLDPAYSTGKSAIAVDKSFIYPGITIRDVLSMLCQIYTANAMDVYIEIDSSDEDNRTITTYIPNSNSDGAYGINYPSGNYYIWEAEDLIESVKSDYYIPIAGNILIGDMIIPNNPRYTNANPTRPCETYDISNNKMMNALSPTDEQFESIIRSAMWAGTRSTWQHGPWYETSHPEISFPVKNLMYARKILISTIDFLTCYKDSLSHSSKKIFLKSFADINFIPNPGINGMYTSFGVKYYRPDIGTGYTWIEGGYFSRVLSSFYNGTWIECNSDEHRTSDNDWEGRPFINDITTVIDGEEVSLYPDHVYGWKIRGVNCPTDDYSIGNISSYYEMTFDSDIRLPVGQQGKVIGDDSFIFEVVGVERKIRTKNIYTETCIITVNEVDEVIPDSSLTPVTNETLDALAYRLLGVHLPSIAINKNYVVNKDWAYSGITKRQLAQWIYQLAGISYCGYGQDSDIVGNERSYFAPSVCPTYVRHAFHFNENDTKSIDKADYQTQVIDKIWFTNDNTNSGFSYGTGTQQLTVPYNPLIDTSDTSFIQPLFNKVNSLVAYTPMKIETFLGKITLSELIRIYAGSTDGSTGREFMTWMMYYDPEVEEAYYCPIFNWEASDSGIILEGTGSKDRRVSNSYLDYDTQQTGRYAKISSAASSAASEAGQVSGDVTALSNRVSNCEDDIAQNALDIQSKVSNTDYNGNTIINKINANGVTQTISSSRVDLSSCVPSSSYNGDTIIDKINAFGVTGVIDASRVDLSGLTTTYDGTSIITAINDSTTVGIIDANKVDLSGYTPPAYTGDSLINSINAVGVTSVIDADRLDLSGYVQDSELSNYVQDSELSNYVPNTSYTGDEIISRINSAGVTSTIDGSRISGDLSTEDYSLDSTGLTFFDGNGVTTTVYPSGGLITDFSGTSNFRYVTDYTNTQNFTIPAGKHFCVEVQVFPTNSGSGLPTGLLIAGAPDENQELVTSSIIKEVINTSMPTSEKLSLTLVGKADTTITYYVWIKTDSPYASMTTSYIGWYM